MDRTYIGNEPSPTPIQTSSLADGILTADATGRAKMADGFVNTAKLASGLTLAGIVTLSGGALKFPAAQAVSSDANTLDDYEEGTYTPTITAGSGTFTTVSGTGEYIKIGKLIVLTVNISITTVGTAASFINFTLPFACTSSVWGVFGREYATSGYALTGKLAAHLTLLLNTMAPSAQPTATPGLHQLFT